jgi:hypothetical protein
MHSFTNSTWPGTGRKRERKADKELNRKIKGERKNDERKGREKRKKVT